MLSWIRSRARDRRTAIEFYGASVAQARQPGFFAGHGVEDTPEGRVAMIIVVLFPLLERLQAEGSHGRRLARYVSETFVTDVDDSLREMGVGDMSVPKKVKRAAQALGERCLAYRRAAASPEPASALAEEMSITVPGLAPVAAGTRAVAGYSLAALAHIEAIPAARLLAGELSFPPLSDQPALGDTK